MPGRVFSHMSFPRAFHDLNDRAPLEGLPTSGQVGSNILDALIYSLWGGYDSYFTSMCTEVTQRKMKPPRELYCKSRRGPFVKCHYNVLPSTSHKSKQNKTKYFSFSVSLSFTHTQDTKITMKLTWSWIVRFIRGSPMVNITLWNVKALISSRLKSYLWQMDTKWML